MTVNAALLAALAVTCRCSRLASDVRPVTHACVVLTISLTTFIDFVAATGTGRITKVRNAKRQYDAEWDASKDFYKPLRDRILKCAGQGWDKKALNVMLKEVTDTKKIPNYAECEKGLVKWIGTKKSVTAVPAAAKALWTSGDLTIRVNPELLVDDGGNRYVVKLYFKSDDLSSAKAQLILHLMSKSSKLKGTMAVLDTRRGKVFVHTKKVDGIDALLKAEASALSQMWTDL